MQILKSTVLVVLPGVLSRPTILHLRSVFSVCLDCQLRFLADFCLEFLQLSASESAP